MLNQTKIYCYFRATSRYINKGYLFYQVGIFASLSDLFAYLIIYFGRFIGFVFILLINKIKNCANNLLPKTIKNRGTKPMIIY